MKEGNKKRFRKLGWMFADHLLDRKFFKNPIRGNSKKTEDRAITKSGRNSDKKEAKRLIDEAINS